MILNQCMRLAIFLVILNFIILPQQSIAVDAIGENIAKSHLQRNIPDLHSIAQALERTLHDTETIIEILRGKAHVGEPLGYGVRNLKDNLLKIQQYEKQIAVGLNDFKDQLIDMGLSEKVQALEQYKNQITQEINGVKSLIRTINDIGDAIPARRRASKDIISNLKSNLDILRDRLKNRKKEKAKFAGAELPLVFTTPTTPPVTASVPTNVVFNLIDAPTSADLLSTKKVTITPRIQALAASLGNSSIRIYEYVKNNIEYVPYYGTLKNAETVLLSKRGNDYDQATLLIALFRAAGIPARYARSPVMIPNEDVKNWLEVKREEVAYRIFEGFGDTEVAMATDDGTETGTYIGVIKEQVWVVAYIPYGNYRGSISDQSDKRWVSLDPSFKTRNIQTGIALDLTNASLNYDYTSYISSISRKVPAELYRDQIRSFLKTNYPGKAITDVPYRGNIIKEDNRVIPSNLPYIIARTPSTFYEIEDENSHRIKFNIKKTDGTVLLSYPYRNLAEISDKNLTISFVAATAADQAIVDSYGGFDQVPTTAVLNVLPVIKEQGVPVFTGTSPVSYGEDLDVKLTWLDFSNGYVTTDPKLPTAKNTTSKLVAGNFMSILLDLGQASNDYLNFRIDRFLEAHNAISGAEKNSEFMMGEMLYIAGMRYAQLLDEYFRMVEDLDQVRLYKSSFNVGTTSMTNRVSYVFGQSAFAVKADSFVIDGKSGSILIFQLGDKDPDTYEPAREAKLAGYTFAALEHQVWEEITRLNAISTVKGLQLAGENNITIYELVPADSTTICLLYTYNGENWCANNPDDVANSRVIGGKELTIKVSTYKKIKADLEAGRNITIPKQTLGINSWQGEVWISYDPTSHSYGFMISGKTGSAGGGSTTTSTPFSPPPPLDPTGTRSLFGNNMDISPVTGNLNVSGTDFQINGRGIPVSFSRSYNSQLKYDGPMGYGWTHSLNLYLQERDDDGDNTPNEAEDTDGVISSVRLFDASGGQIDFAVAESGTYTNDPGVYSTLTKDIGTEIFTLVEKGGTKMTFGPLTASGKAKLATMVDPHGNTITLSYNGPGGNLDKVTDTVSRELLFRYQLFGGKQRLIEIEDWTGRKWQYGYDDVGNLTSFRHPIAVNNPNMNPVRYEYYERSDIAHNIKNVIQPLGDMASFVYYANDRVYKQFNSLGETTTYRYNVFRQEATIIDPLGYESRVEYDTDGNIVRSTDPLGAIRETKYDSNRNIIKTIDAYGNSTYYNKDESGVVITIDKGNITHVTNRLGNISRKLDYHPVFNKPRQVIDAKGNVTNLIYNDANGDLLTKSQTVTLRKGEPDEYVATIISENEYDQYGNLTKSTVAKGVAGLERSVTSNYELDESGAAVTYPGLNLMRSTDALGNAIYFTYDALDRRTSKYSYRQIAPDNTANYRIVTTYTYDDVDRAIEVKDPVGNITVREYDDNNRILHEYMKIPDTSGSFQEKYRVQHVYDLAGREIKTIDPLGNYSTREYDAKGQLVAVTDALGRTTRYEYDPAGRKIKTIDPDGATVETVYDLEGRVISEIDPLGNVSYIEYDAEGRVTKETDELLRETRYAYDKNDNRTEITDNLSRTTYTRYDELDRVYETETPPVADGPSGATYPVITRYVFDEVGNTRAIKAGHTGMAMLDTVYTYGYDIQGRIKNQTDALGKVVSTGYDQHGNQISVQDGKGQITYYTYDIMGRVIRVQPADGNEIIHTYDQLGNKLSTRNNNANYSYKYDGLLRLSELKDWRFNKIIKYTYDEVSNLISMVGPEGDVTHYRYDATNQLVGISYPDGEGVTYAYDRAGQLVDKDFSVGINVKYSYFSDGNLQSITNYNSTGTLVDENNFTYNPVGLRDSMRDLNGTHTYTYDELGRLTRVDYPVSAIHPAGSYEAFTYDFLGNRYSMDRDGVFTYYNYDAGHRLQDIRAGSPTGTLQYDLAYDDNHNLIEKIATTGTTRYQYDASNDMVGITFDDLSTNRYQYGPNGNRIKMTNKAGVTTQMFYDGDDVLAEYSAGNVVTAEYRHGQSTDELLSVLRGGVRTYYHQDARGSVVATSDNTGATQSTYRYDAYGKILAQTGSANDPYGYTGRRLDADSGLMYYRARYYDAEIGRFTQQDPTGIADGLNLYAYVANDPISKTDPTGLWGMGGGMGGMGGMGRLGRSSFGGMGNSWNRPRNNFSSWGSTRVSWGNIGQFNNRFKALSNLGYKNIRSMNNRFKPYREINGWKALGSIGGIALSASPIGRIGSIFKNAFKAFKTVKWGSSISRLTRPIKAFSKFKPPRYSNISRTDKSWKNLIIGKAQKTGTPGHQFRSYRAAINMAKSGQYRSVYLNRSYSTTTGIRTTPRRLPDVIGIRNNRRVDVVEVPSKTDRRKFLYQRNWRAMQQLPAGMRGNINISKIQ